MRRTAATALAVLLLAGCGGSFPADPDGTLERVTGDVLRVGVSPNPPWTEVGPGGEPSGLEVEIVSKFARTLDARVEWTTGGEESLVADLAESRLDLVVGGLTGRSPWADQAALTTPYTTVPGPQGEPEPHVMAAPLGENAFLVRLETYLLENREDVLP
ncbi:MAG: transporter substrate-binding domain-containing protein [Micrococcales bacterium]|nr:transporter substrate-binding domain-containing protein [Micrococcales bacterium]